MRIIKGFIAHRIKGRYKYTFKKDELKGLSGSQNQVMFLTFKPQSNMKPQIYISRSLQINVLLDEYSLEKHWVIDIVSMSSILKGTYHAKSTFLALKCIVLYIWSVYKYRKD